MKHATMTPVQFGIAFNAACMVVMRECPNEYAKAYARAGLRLNSIGAKTTQCLYILGNMQHWRGEHAKTIREALKALSKVSIAYL